MEIEKATKKIQQYCSGKERCESQIKEKLSSYELHENEIEDILYQLRTLNFWNEERYARAYAHDKQKFNSWGPFKIRYSLSQKHVDSSLIDKALKTIDYKTFKNALQNLLIKKYEYRQFNDKYNARKKLTAYASNKGYTYDMINTVLDEIIPPNE